MGNGQGTKRNNSAPGVNPTQGVNSAPGVNPTQGVNSVQGVNSAPKVNSGQTLQTVKAPVGGSRKRRCWKKNVRGGMATVHWDQIPMRQPPNDVMEKATTAPRSLLGGRRRSHKRRGHKKSHKAKRHHRRSKRHHRKH
jgi:hypothetical protein